MNSDSHSTEMCSGARTLTIREALAEGAAVLRAGGVAEARREAASLLAYASGRERAYLIAHDDDSLDAETAARFRSAVARRARGEPVQYVTGRQEFYGLEFEVTPDVLIPRPETELLVETALELLKEIESPYVCDVGTGSGCVIVTMLHERADARGVALDISPAALGVAERNAARHGVRDRLELLASDGFDALPSAKPDAMRFQMIVSNPPYIAEAELAGLQREVRDHEPVVALTPGGDGLGLVRRLVTESPRHLKRGGQLLFEIGFNQHEDVARMIDARVWTTLGVHKDLQGIPRVFALRLNE